MVRSMASVARVVFGRRFTDFEMATWWLLVASWPVGLLVYVSWLLEGSAIGGFVLFGGTVLALLLGLSVVFLAVLAFRYCKSKGWPIAACCLSILLAPLFAAVLILPAGLYAVLWLIRDVWRYGRDAGTDYTAPTREEQMAADIREIKDRLNR